MWPQERCVAKSVDLESVQGNILRNVIRTRKSSGVVELTRLTGSAQMLWEREMANQQTRGCKTVWQDFSGLNSGFQDLALEFIYNFTNGLDILSLLYILNPNFSHVGEFMFQ